MYITEDEKTSMDTIKRIPVRILSPPGIKQTLCVFFYLMLLFQTPVHPLHRDLTEMSLEELMQIEVVTVSKKSERLFDASAAIFTITEDDMAQAGIQTIPDAMRLAPGVQVGHVDANKWAISARGFNMLFANKLLVMKDGRSVYTRIFSGVCWESQDVLVSDLDRIEVIRGPGATLWGANAVNGVINIITKPASETQGGYLQLGLGTVQKKALDFRYGGRLSEKIWYRVYGKYADHGPLVFADGKETEDGWQTVHGGFRMDIPWSPRNRVTVICEANRVHTGQTLAPDYFDPDLQIERIDAGRVTGGHVLGRWEHTFSDDSDCAFQWFIDTYQRDDPLLVQGGYQRLDLDFQHRFALTARHQIIWGIGSRFTRDWFDNTIVVNYDPAERRYSLYNTFIQDEIRLIPDRIHLTVGTKLEWTESTRFSLQPNLRMRWSPSSRQTLWWAASRAVRTPSRSDLDVRLVKYLFADETYKTWGLLQGTPGVPVEVLYAVESGYRLSPSDHFLADLAVFYNRYDNLRTFNLGTPFTETKDATQNIYIPFIAGSDRHGESAGFETALEFRPFTKSRMRLAYTYFRLRLFMESGVTNYRGNDAETESPQHQATLFFSVKPIRHINLGVTCRFVDRLESLSIDRYLTADISLGWRINRMIELSLSGRNLFGGPHAEFIGETVAPFEKALVRRGFRLTSHVTW